MYNKSEMGWLSDIFGVHSKNTSEVLTDIVTHIVMDSIQNCTSIAQQDQVIRAKEVTGDIDISDVIMSQGSSVDMSCVMSATKQNEISDKVSKALTQQLEANGQAVLSMFGNTTADAEAKLKNAICNKLDASAHQQMVAQVNQKQGYDFGIADKNLILHNITMIQSQHIVANALLQTTAYSSVIDDVATKIDQHSTSTSSNPITDVITGFGTAVGKIFSTPLVFFLVFLLVIGAAGVGYEFYLKPILNSRH